MIKALSGIWKVKGQEAAVDSHLELRGQVVPLSRQTLVLRPPLGQLGRERLLLLAEQIHLLGLRCLDLQHIAVRHQSSLVVWQKAREKTRPGPMVAAGRFSAPLEGKSHENAQTSFLSCIQATVSLLRVSMSYKNVPVVS